MPLQKKSKIHFISLYFLAYFFFPNNLFSQESQLKVEDVSHYRAAIKINEDIELIVLRLSNNPFNTVFKFDKSDNSLDSINNISNGWNFANNSSNYLASETGMFYSKSYYANDGNTLLYNLNWIDLDGNIVSSNTLLSYPTLLGAKNNYLYYTVKNSNDDFILQRFDYTTSQIANIETFQENILRYFKNDTLEYFITNDNSNLIEFHSYEAATGLESEISMPSNSTQISFLDKINNLNYFRVRTDSSEQVWEVDFSLNEANLYAELPRFVTIDLANDLFYKFTPGDHYRGVISNSNIIDTIYFSKELEDYNPRIINAANNGLIRGYTYKHGFEPFLISDSIYLLKDFGSGLQSGWVNKVDGNFSFDYTTSPYFIHNVDNNASYTMMSNFADSKIYLYSISDTLIQSYFPIEEANLTIKTDKHNDRFYWWTFGHNTFTINHRSLVNNLSPQQEPDSTNSDLTWGKNLYYVNKNQFYNYNERQQLGNVKLLDDGGVLTSTRMASSYNYVIADDKYNIIDEAYGGFLVYRQDSFGNLLWHSSFGDQNFGGWANNPILMDTDSNGDVYVSGVFFKNFFTKEDTLSVNRCANFIKKIDGQTGETIWFKVISQNFYFSDFHIDQMKVIDDEITMSFTYKDFQCSIDGTLLTNQFASPINALAKFDLNGDLIFAKNTPTSEWLNDYGHTWIMDSYESDIFTVQSQGAYNVSSSCNFQDWWGYYNQLIDNKGNIKKTIPITSSDIGSATCGFINNKNLFAFGYYRGEMDLHYFNNTTPLGNSCNLRRGFMYRYDIEKEEFSEMKVSIEEFYPFDAKYYNQHYYVYGRGVDKELTIVKFDKFGNELGYKQLDQFMQDLTFNAFQFFDVSDEYIVVAGDMFRRSEEYKIPRKATTHRYTTIIKTSNDNWSNDKKIFENRERIFTSDLEDDIVIYPNPFSETFSIMFEDPIYTDLEIYDLSGKIIKRFSLNDDFVQHFNTSDFAKGMFVVRVFNETTTKVLKVIKY